MDSGKRNTGLPSQENRKICPESPAPDLPVRTVPVTFDQLDVSNTLCFSNQAMLGRLEAGASMTTTITRRAYWVVLSMVLVLFFTPGLFAQSRPVSASRVARDMND